MAMQHAYCLLTVGILWKLFLFVIARGRHLLHYLIEHR